MHSYFINYCGVFINSFELIMTTLVFCLKKNTRTHSPAWTETSSAQGRARLASAPGQPAHWPFGPRPAPAPPTRITPIRRPRALCPRLYTGQDPLFHPRRPAPSHAAPIARRRRSHLAGAPSPAVLAPPRPDVADARRHHLRDALDAPCRR